MQCPYASDSLPEMGFPYVRKGVSSAELTKGSCSNSTGLHSKLLPPKESKQPTGSYTHKHLRNCTLHEDCCGVHQAHILHIKYNTQTIVVLAS